MSERVSTIINIHQAIHGYRDGHDLISSSTKLSNDSRRIMLVLSDMSGPSMTRGFECYLTAYPLLEDNYYAIARTWYAPEMERPGCVWTHSLLIEFADLARVKLLSLLNKLFVRPNTSTASSYDTPLTLDVRKWIANDELTFKRHDIARDTLTALYEYPQNPVVIAADRPDDYESLLLEIWSQQWPRLRRSFSFCTGSISARKTPIGNFDLQIVPKKRVQQIQRDLPNLILLEDRPDASISSADCHWLSHAESDLHSNISTTFREYLWDSAIDIEGGRDTFSRLASIYDAIMEARASEDYVANLVLLVASNFPSSFEAIRLKQSLFGDGSNKILSLQLETDEAHILRHIVTTSSATAYDPDALSIRTRARILWQSDSDSAHSILLDLLHKEMSPIGEEYIRGVSDVLDAEKAVDLTRGRPGLLAVFVRLKPILAASKELWHSRDTDQRELVEAIMSSAEDHRDVITKIIPTMVREVSNSTVPYVVDNMNEDMLVYVLDELKVLPTWQSRSWRNAFREHPELLLKYLRSGADTPVDLAHIIVSLLDPNSDTVRSMPVSTWIWVSDLMKNRSATSDSDVELSVFLLALAFQSSGEQYDRLASASFETVHEAAAHSRLTFDSWMILEHNLPKLSMWRNWDRCERLRRGLVEKFAGCEWSSQEFLKCTQSMSLFESVVESACATEAGTQYLERIRKDLKKGRIEAPDNQRLILDKRHSYRN